MKNAFMMGILFALFAGAQTRLDLANQARNANMSNATSVVPFPTGVSLPAACTVGQLFFLTSAPVGANQCVATNTWAAIQGASTSNSANTVQPIGVQQTGGQQLTIGPGCAISTPCIFAIGSSVYSMQAPATVTVSGGTGLAYVYLDGSGNLTAGTSSLTLTCSGCVVVSGVNGFPAGVIPMETWNATNGAWDPAGTNQEAVLSTPAALKAGSNITLTQTPTGLTISDTGIDGSSFTSTPAGTFNPTDPTQFYLNHFALFSGWSGADGWGYTGGCAQSQGTGAVGFSAESIVPGIWGQASGAGSACFFAFPDGPTYGNGTYDYWSGMMPANLWVSATLTSKDTNGTSYVGLAGTYSNASDFIGCRQSGAGDWFAVIEAGGVDVATADTGFAHDTNTHRITVDNYAGTPNAIRCSVDGASTAVAMGTIPAEGFGWGYIVGTIAAGSAPAAFGSYQYTIFLQGLPRL